MADKTLRQKKEEKTLEKNPGFCPFLGFADDPETAVSYPSKMNCCNHAKPVVPVASEYQYKYCLTRQFVDCPVYQKEKVSSLPTDMQEESSLWEKTRPIVPFIALILVLAVGFVLSLWLGVIKIPGIGITPTVQVASPTSGSIIPTSITLPTETENTEVTEPIPTRTNVIATRIIPHMLEIPIGTSPELIVHKVLEGEGYIWMAQNYNTTGDAIKAINYNLPESLWVNKALVIPVNTSDVAGIPPFSAYEIDSTGMTIEKLAELMRVDVEILKKYNALPAGYEFIIGEWLLIPH